MSADKQQMTDENHPSQMDHPTGTARQSRLWSRETTIGILICESRAVVSDLYEMWLGERFSIRKATTAEKAVEEMDHTVAVAIIDLDLPDDGAHEISDEIWDRYPHCQTIVVSDRSEPFVDATIGADAYLSEPVTKETFQENVRESVLRGMYGAALHQYLHLSTLLASQEVKSTDEELASNEAYADIQEQFARVQCRLDEITDQLGKSDFDAWAESFEVRKQFRDRTEVFADADGEMDKYHPDKCQDCGISWGTDHGGTTGMGYTPLGAFVFRCNNCGEVVKDPGPSHRRVARR